ncbi:MAG: DUF2771 family protein [Gordonia sp. (in: high G+C Gram-positive bacteria)]|uniref:DUF2771 family protein n=1 Tax=Gordonia sp. (in: high G+C Gram-positive bacteria) TaxID=84139 RepID=UPI0039E49CCE
MSLQPSDKKALALVTAGAVAVAAVIALVTTLLVVRGADHHDDPRISLAADRDYERVAPTFFCDLKMEECRPRPLSNEEIARLPQASFPVETGRSLTLSVPTEVAEAPWQLTAVYATPAGIVPVLWWHRSGATSTQVLASTADRTLLGIEIKPVSTVVVDAPDGADGLEAGQGDILFRGHYSVATAPRGYAGPPNPKELPAERG